MRTDRFVVGVGLIAALASVVSVGGAAGSGAAPARLLGCIETRGDFETRRDFKLRNGPCRASEIRVAWPPSGAAGPPVRLVLLAHPAPLDHRSGRTDRRDRSPWPSRVGYNGAGGAARSCGASRAAGTDRRDGSSGPRGHRPQRHGDAVHEQLDELHDEPRRGSGYDRAQRDGRQCDDCDRHGQFQVHVECRRGRLPDELLHQRCDDPRRVGRSRLGAHRSWLGKDRGRKWHLRGNAQRRNQHRLYELQGDARHALLDLRISAHRQGLGDRRGQQQRVRPSSSESGVGRVIGLRVGKAGQAAPSLHASSSARPPPAPAPRSARSSRARGRGEAGRGKWKPTAVPKTVAPSCDRPSTSGLRRSMRRSQQLDKCGRVLSRQLCHLAGDAVLVAVKALVVRHREVVELRASLEVRHRITARRLVSRALLAEAVRPPTRALRTAGSSRAQDRTRAANAGELQRGSVDE